MAKAAEDAVWWARLQTWLGGFGFVVVIGTLIFTGKAARAASRSARTAERALTDLERPFVYVAITDSGLGMMGEAYGSYDRALAFECVNLGRTPADLWDLKEEVVELDKDKWPEPVTPSKGDRSLPPGVVAATDRPYKSKVPTHQLFGHRTRGRLGVDSNLFFIGYVRYADVFNVRYVTGFCAIYDVFSGEFVLRGDQRYNYTRKES